MERIIVIIVVISFSLTSIETIIVQGTPLSEEEAIEISRHTQAVQVALSEPGIVTIGRDYWSANKTKQLKDKNPNEYAFQKLPNDHGIWRIHWEVMPPGYQILHYIDELTRQILYESVVCSG